MRLKSARRKKTLTKKKLEHLKLQEIDLKEITIWATLCNSPDSDLFALGIRHMPC